MLDLFDGSRRLYRRNAPDTSKAAAEKLDATRLEKIVLDVISQHPHGVISDEVRAICRDRHGIDAYSSVTARYRALADKGLIEFAGTRPGASGRQQRVMRRTQ
jgi:hypothetical protein